MGGTYEGVFTYSGSDRGGCDHRTRCQPDEKSKAIKDDHGVCQAHLPKRSECRRSSGEW